MSSFTFSESVFIHELIDKYGLEKVLSSTTIEAQCLNETDSENQLNKVLNLIICKEWFSLNVFSYLGIRDVAKFDSAFTNNETRRLWLKCPKLQLSNEKDNFNNDLPIYWCTKKNIYYINFHAAYVCSAKTDITNNGLTSLSTQCKFLQHLSILGVDELTETGLPSICRNSPVLNYFNITSTNNMFHTRQRTISHLNILHNLSQYCPLLKYLALQYFDLSHKDSIHSFMTSNWKNLKYIKLLSTSGLNDEFLINIGLKCPLLESVILTLRVNLSSDLRITNQGIHGIFQSCPFLKILKLNMLHRIDDEAFINMSSYCPLLEEVQMENAFIGDDTLIELGKLRFLKVIYFPNSHDITADGIFKLVSNAATTPITAAATISTTANTTTAIMSTTGLSSMDSNKQHLYSTSSYLSLPSSSSSSLPSSSSSLLSKITLCMRGSEVLSRSLRILADHCPQLKSVSLNPQVRTSHNHNNNNNNGMNNSNNNNNNNNNGMNNSNNGTINNHHNHNHSNGYSLDESLHYLIITKCKQLIEFHGFFTISIEIKHELHRRQQNEWMTKKKSRFCTATTTTTTV